MRPALEGQGGRVTDVMVEAMAMARQVNATFGTAFAPWEMLDVPVDWVDGMRMYNGHVNKARNDAKIEAILNRGRK